MSIEKNKYCKLADLLWRRTKEKKISWGYEDKSKKVTCWISSRVLNIREANNTNFEELYIVSVFNQSGDFLEGFNDEEINDFKPDDENYSNYFELMGALYISAKRQAIGADEALDDILLKLESGEDINDPDDVPF